MSTELEKREKQKIGSTAVENLTHSGPAYSPDVDIYISDILALFMVELPGVKMGDVSIEVDETNSLIIRGKNSDREYDNPLLRQYRIGDYYRAFQLSNDYDKEHITAKLDNGLLEISIPKKEEAKPKRIEIKV